MNRIQKIFTLILLSLTSCIAFSDSPNNEAGDSAHNPTHSTVISETIKGLQLEYYSIHNKEFRMPDWGLANPRWLNPTTIQFDQVNRERNNSIVSVVAKLNGTEGSWKFEEVKSTD
ncbi:MAG: hypothetical protein P8Z37_02080 [Acidobacteriota bacterium]|jgi:hypothetical protein